MQEQGIRNVVSLSLLAAMLVAIGWQGTRLGDKQQEFEMMESARNAQLRRAELIVISAPVAIIMCGEDRMITITNPKAEELFGYPESSLLGHSIDMLLPDDFVDEHREVFDASMDIAREGPDNYLMRTVGVISQAKHRDGTLFDVELSIRVIKYGGKLEFIASLRPVPNMPVEVPMPEVDTMDIPPIEQRVQQATKFQAS